MGEGDDKREDEDSGDGVLEDYTMTFAPLNYYMSEGR
jgi:hypothetical protein